ncbi:MAG: restriction endonuclease subunit S [Leptospiraceae bacterium]|nr:restriction endonuclease subunit S [Leptospiraceae bacterium]MCP5495492.1 restriction endonuclease subunit S [Leptospiraceae bacterium]
MNMVSLGETAKNIIYGLTQSATHSKVGPKFLRITDIQDETVNWKDVPYCKCTKNEIDKYSLNPGDILFARSGATTGKTFLVKRLPEKSVFASYLIKIQLNENIANSYFVSYFLKSTLYWKQIKDNSVGATLPNVNGTKLKSIHIPLPPLDEQKRIASLLERADKLRSMRKFAIAQTETYLQSLFIEMFDKADKNLEPISNFCEINPINNKILKVSDNNEVSFIPMNSISENGNIIVYEKRKYKDVKKGFTSFKEGDVLFAKITPCMENGKGVIARNLINQIGFGSTEFHVLRPIKNISTSEWLFYLTKQKSFRKHAEKNMTGSAGQRRVPASFFDRFITFCPPLELQNRFAEQVEKIERIKLQQQEALRQAEHLFQGMLHRAFNGEL